MTQSQLRHQLKHCHCRCLHAVQDLSMFSFALLKRTLLPSVCQFEPGHPGYDQRDLVTWQWRALLHHHSDIVTRTRKVPHSGHPLPDGMHHLRHQIHHWPWGHQQLGTQIRVQIRWILIQWGKIYTYPKIKCMLIWECDMREESYGWIIDVNKLWTIFL